MSDDLEVSHERLISLASMQMPLGVVTHDAIANVGAVTGKGFISERGGCQVSAQVLVQRSESEQGIWGAL